MPKRLNRDEAMRIMGRKGEDAEVVANDFRISTDTVYAIWRGDRWKNLADPRQTGTSQTRLPDADIEIIKNLCGKMSPEEVSQIYQIAPGSVLNIWRGKRRS